ncbi:MAG: aminotransferase class V-fold PLP-dependent enzyme [Bacteroidia bacterium]|nr:aminotransferase class V-fold PLP-dependent enzyme [Bacteroidia bacterium]
MERRKFLSAAALLAISPSLGAEIFPKTTMPSLPSMPNEEDWNTIRNLFPLKSDKIFLNNGTMGITPLPVLHYMQHAFLETAENGSYPSHNDDLQKLLGGLIGAELDELTITKNVSEGTNHVCWGIPLKKKDEVILTTHEHVGGALPWINRARLEGIVIKTINPGKTAAETLKNIEAAITKKTRVIAVPHIPCTIGQIFPVKEICALARSKNIISAIDGAHPLGMLSFNVKEIGCDYYYGCLHKWALGPLGVGFLYINKTILDQTRCTHIAAYSNTDFNMNATPPTMGGLVNTAHRFTYGTYCGPLWSGAVKALEFYKHIGPERIEKRSRGLTTTLQNKLLEFGNKIEMLTPTEEISRGCQIGFRIKNNNPKANQEFISECNKKRIILRYVGESGIDCVRVSTHYYNNETEVERLIEELKTFLG